MTEFDPIGHIYQYRYQPSLNHNTFCIILKQLRNEKYVLERLGELLVDGVSTYEETPMALEKYYELIS